MLLTLLSLVALAGPDLRPAASPADAEALWAQRRAGASPLACEPLLQHVVLCFKLWENGARRWVMESDLVHWKTTGPQLRASIEAQTRKVLDTEPHEVPIEGMTARYWILKDSDGWAVAPILYPHLLLKRMGLPPGTQVRIAIPKSGVLLAWAPAGSEVDQVMAVGVREFYDPAEDAVTPMVYAWSGTAWRPFGAARPTKGETSDGR